MSYKLESITEHHEGIAAFRARIRPGANPYEPGTLAHGRWNRGWNFARWQHRNELLQYNRRNQALI